MSRLTSLKASLRIAAAFSATVFTAAALLYAPIGLGTESPEGMAVRTHALWAVLVLSAAATWILATKPETRLVRLVSGVAGGFDLIWIFSFVGPPVVLAGLAAVCVAAIGAPRRVGLAVFALAIVGLGLGLVLLRLTQPAGEHIFG